MKQNNLVRTKKGEVSSMLIYFSGKSESEPDTDPTFQLTRIRIPNTPAESDDVNLLICLRCLNSIPVTAKRATNAAHLSFLTCVHNINRWLGNVTKGKLPAKLKLQSLWCLMGTANSTPRDSDFWLINDHIQVFMKATKFQFKRLKLN
jgi:hypothetical protein